MNIKHIRQEYAKHSLDEKDVSKNPLHQFDTWFKEAMNALGEGNDPHAFILSTSGADNQPLSRVLLLREYTETGMVFYSNYNSKKGKQLAENPRACMLFFWSELQRQIRIEGLIEKHTEKDADEYFASRPRESQIGAWASEQSQEIKDRATLELHVKQLEEKFKNQPVPRPPYWGGYILKPTSFEFWQGRPSRLHDRIVYEKTEADSWRISRLSP